jgi:anti-sigma regulatory factor (Ser/Thr protein kinase)
MARILLPAIASSVALARRLVVGHALTDMVAAGCPVGFLDPDLLTLVVTELVTNAIRHGTSPAVDDKVLIETAVLADGIEIVVVDSGGGQTVPAVGEMPPSWAESGRGLPIVEALTGHAVKAEQVRGLGRVTALVPWRSW